MGKAISSVVNPVARVVKNVPIIGKPIASGLRSTGNILSDTLLGEETPGTPDEVIDLADPMGRSLQKQSLGSFGKLLNQDMGQMATTQTANLEKQARANVQDQEMRAKQMVAQRGLGNTSIGLNAILGQNQDLGNQIGSIRANQPLLANQLNKENLQFASGGINQILNEQGQSKVFRLGQQAQGRSGGLLGMALPVAGQIAGGMAGSGAFNKFV